MYRAVGGGRNVSRAVNGRLNDVGCDDSNRHAVGLSRKVSPLVFSSWYRNPGLTGDLVSNGMDDGSIITAIIDVTAAMVVVVDRVFTGITFIAFMVKGVSPLSV